jgi:hypothetical protein
MRLLGNIIWLVFGGFATGMGQQPVGLSVAGIRRAVTRDLMQGRWGSSTVPLPEREALEAEVPER